MKKSQSQFNMSALIREVLTGTPQMSSAQMIEEIQRRHPGVKINKNSFSVAFYTARQRLGRGRRRANRHVSARRAASGKCDLNVMRSAADFLRNAGGYDKGLEALKMVQAVQLK